MNRRAPLIAGGAMAAVAVLLVFLLVLPKMGQVGDVQDQLTEAENQELTLETQLRALQEAQANAPETERQIAQIEEQIPPTADLPALFNQLQAAADRSAVDFFSFSPGTPLTDTSQQFSVISSQITVTGSYFALDEFLFLMETFPRAAKVQSIAVTPVQSTDTATSSLQMLIAIQFYTTDVSAGPASVPGPTEGATTAPTGVTGPTSTTGAAT